MLFGEEVKSETGFTQQQYSQRGNMHILHVLYILAFSNHMVPYTEGVEKSTLIGHIVMQRNGIPQTATGKIIISYRRWPFPFK